MVASKKCSSFKGFIFILAIVAVFILAPQLFIPLETNVNGSIPSKQEFLGVLPSFVSDKKEKQSAGHEENAGSRSPAYHVVFSTSCTDQQNWESMVLFYHAMKVKQPGNITRIASGCSKEKASELTKFHEDHIRTMSEHFHLHLTPDFSRVQLDQGKFSYKYMNKPYGLRHWMEESLGMNINASSPPEVEDGIVILMDPDMILLRPLLHDFTREEVIFVEKEPATRVVRHGQPMAQQDGYLRNEWMKHNFSYVANKPKGQHISRPVWDEGPRFWNTGPPYLATVKDMYNIAVLWTEYAPRVVDRYPGLFAEMYGYIHATVQLKLPHTLIKSIVVSTTTTNDREGWEYVDALRDDEVCSPSASAKLPIGLHYCKRYFLGKWFFSKYRVKKNIMDCQKHLFRQPPSDISVQYDFAIMPPRADMKKSEKEERKQITGRQIKREAFMLCGMTAAVNEALMFHKRKKCGKSANLSETYSIHDDPTNY